MPQISFSDYSTSIFSLTTVVLTPPHLPYTPSTNCAHLFTNCINSSANYDNTSVDCINFSIDYANEFDDCVNVIDD
jgi:hypothetical protein